jgi:cell wall-associated NlpC family hydrolase
MTSVAPAVDPAAPAIVQQMAAVRAAAAGLGSQISTDAESGDFAGILSAIQGVTAPIGVTSPVQSASPAAVTTLGSVAVPAPGVSAAHDLSGGAGGLTGSAVVADASNYLGVPYQWGGTSPSTGFDCSGFVQHVYGDLGVSLPRTSQEQSTVGQPVASLAQAQPGDLLFFEPGSSGPGHVGIYVGNGQMIDAPHTGTSVQIQSAGTPCAIRRVLPTAAGGIGGALGPGTTPSGATSAGSSLGVPSNLAPMFLSTGATYGVSPQLLAAVAKTESGFNPAAVSSAGAEGLMQIMPTTAQGLGIDPYDPAQAINGAAQILSGDLAKFGSVPLALAAYNAGAGAVEQYGGIPPYPETQHYVSTIMGLLGGTGQ